MKNIENGMILMVDPEREQDVVKREASGSISRYSYVSMRSMYNRIPNNILEYEEEY